MNDPKSGSTLELGPLRIILRSAPYPWQGTPAAGGESQSGTATVAGLTGAGGIAVDVAVITWTASREVAAIDCHGSPPRIQRLGHGGRIGIHPAGDGDEWMELRVSRLTSADWSSEFQVALGDLDTIARLPVEATLLELGAAAVGTRATILGESGRRRNELAMRFPAGATVVPVAAYGIVRILPLLFGHGQDAAAPTR